MTTLVGISTSELRVPPHVDPLPESDPARRELALGLDYPRALDAAGAVPVVIPPMAASDLATLVERIDGLMLSGGPDLHPGHYGATPHRCLGPTERDLDAFELGLLRCAEDRGLPILAICRGVQALNVARGGTLHQHLPDAGSPVEHRQRQPGTVATHDVRIEPGSRLAGVFGATTTTVNSFHHQAIDRLGDRLCAVGWASDGVIEAVEAPDRAFVVGVQWHAESLAARDDHARLFAAFVAAAATHAARARPRAA